MPRVNSAKTPALRVNDLLFVNAYLSDEFARNGTKAYQAVHPRCSYDVARNRASIVLAKDCVQQEIARRVQYKGGITRQLVESSLLTAHHLALEQRDPEVIASVSMDCAKLAGFLIEKRQDVSDPVRAMTDEELWAALEARVMAHKSLDAPTPVAEPSQPQTVTE